MKPRDPERREAELDLERGWFLWLARMPRRPREDAADPIEESHEVGE